ncbi:mannose-6-phosphate isomerase, class I [Hamadaea tsunoensis]|uniref:mannose-6-phosphate isomerase, class I n=1 Tax=Hamadaea tsunoensis TaxID=53368 RepID=UPI0003F6F1C1|nr:mannose-6-phosphate isomerase, class I [Hamadaea tsunoensis]
MQPLTSIIQPYAWGSRTAIAALQGRPAADGPEAELWIGAHPSGPSRLPSGPLDQAIADEPSLLGDAVEQRFGPRLPYLLKVLAADAPLSLQAHPDLDRARSAYAAGDVNYVDGNHKPELLVATEPFDALCGFRPADASAKVLDALGIPALAVVVDLLAAGDLRQAVETLLRWPAGERRELVAAAAAHPLAGELAARYPDDMGVLVALLLNHVTLEPGDGIWMPAGNLHAYLRGVGVEIMAASDNVLRGGLTPKRVDVDELLAVLRFEPLLDPILPAVPVRDNVVTWPVPVDDFALHRITGTATLDPEGPRTVLCLRGEFTVTDDAGPTMLRGGEAAFGAAGGGPLRIEGTGELYLATIGD